jgi:hypothetical protein
MRPDLVSHLSAVKAIERHLVAQNCFADRREQTTYATKDTADLKNMLNDDEPSEYLIAVAERTKCKKTTRRDAQAKRPSWCLAIQCHRAEGK